MKKFELIWKIVLAVVLVASVVLFILEGNHLVAWVINAVLYCFMLWQMFCTLCDKLDTALMGIHAILLGKVEEVVIKKKADDETKAETEAPEQK